MGEKVKVDALGILRNTIEQMAADADDKGEESFGMTLWVKDAKIIAKALTEMGKSKHGKWQIVPYIDRIGCHCMDSKCSKCGYRLYQPRMLPNYCSYCGAKMEEDDEQIH